MCLTPNESFDKCVLGGGGEALMKDENPKPGAVCSFIPNDLCVQDAHYSRQGACRTAASTVTSGVDG